MAEEHCPGCGDELASEELWLMKTAVAFPLLGRDLAANSPERTCLQVLACPKEGTSYARWHDQPREPLRRINPETTTWVD